MLQPIESPLPSWQPRFAASMMPGPPPVVNVRKGVEPLHELPHDPEHAPRVGLGEGPPLARQLGEETLVLSDDVALRAARALRHGHLARCRGRDIGGEYTVPHVHSTGRCRLPAPGPSCTWASLCGRS